MSRQVTKTQLRSLKTRPGDCRIAHVLLTRGADADLLYLHTAYRALVLKPVSNSAIMRRALNLLTESIAGLHGPDGVKAEIAALEHERKPPAEAA